jgi:hypothetical protein
MHLTWQSSLGYPDLEWSVSRAKKADATACVLNGVEHVVLLVFHRRDLELVVGITATQQLLQTSFLRLLHEQVGVFGEES